MKRRRSLTEQLQLVVASLDRVCPACLAATSQETWDLLHRDKPCATIAARSA